MRIFSSNRPACSRWFSGHRGGRARFFRAGMNKKSGRTASLKRRLLVVMMLLAFIAGMFGLPVASYQSGQSGCGSCASGSCSAGGSGGCRCSEAARNSGTCCCARKNQEEKPEVKSCCARTELIVCQLVETAGCCAASTSQVAEACELNGGCCSTPKESSESSAPRWMACGCGCQSKTLFLTCDDPRLPLELALLHFCSPETGLIRQPSGVKPFYLQCPEPPPPRFS